MNKLVTETVEGTVAVLRLNAPRRINAISLEMREALAGALQERFMDNQCEAIVLAGEGGNFSAGGDLKNSRPESLRDVARTLRHKIARLQDLVRMIIYGPKPVVAAIEGKALGAGLSLALACDGIVAAPSASFGAVFGKVGLVPDGGLLYTLPRRVGPARAQRLLLSASVVDAAGALEIGLVDKVVATEDLVATACADARRLGEIAPLSLAAIKSLGAGASASLEDAFAQELRLQPLLAMTNDNREARAAFAERRTPAFRGC